MHELSTVRALCTEALAAAHEAGASEVTHVRIRIGALSHLSPSHLRDHFSALAADSVLSGAHLEIAVDDDPGHPHAQEVELVSLEVI